MRKVEFLDDATRPSAPRLPGVSPEQRRHGRQLAMIHQLHLAQLAEVRLAMEQAQSNLTHATRVQEAVASLDMIASFRQFGNLCGRECQALTYRHRSEDHEIFPLVRPVDDGVARVVDRLVAEHRVIEVLLENLYAGAQALVVEQSTSAFEALQDTFSNLERVVRSHFAYEEVELEEAIGVAAVPFS